MGSSNSTNKQPHASVRKHRNTKISRTDEDSTTRNDASYKPLQYYRPRIKLEVSVPENKLTENKTITEEAQLSKPKFITKKVFQRVGKKFSVQLDDDERDCSISGLGFLSNSYLVLADFDNKRVKLFDQNLKNLSHLDLQISPKNMCTREQELEAYITFNDTFENGIQVIDIKEDSSMSVIRTIKLAESCYGISSNNGGLAVMVNSPNGWQIHLITLTGTLKAKIIPESGGKNILLRPDYLAVTKDLKLLVSERGNNSLYCFNTKGKMLFHNSRLRQPVGIAHDSNGSILVACPWMIHQLNMSGERIGALMSQDEIGFPPICLSYDDDDSLLVVAGQSNFMVAYKLNDYQVKR